MSMSCGKNMQIVIICTWKYYLLKTCFYFISIYAVEIKT
ncbi:putative membrane protein [Bacteroides fragilis str. I1345]|nr:putative membrane protein [Bacteroides fragilis str. Ds-233]EXZ14692.1 putative membrane protein [Bacteroides fragilis str. Ds-233]EYB17379.1 putative membrane protein [Bacteroides fragilis str. I1345]